MCSIDIRASCQMILIKQLSRSAGAHNFFNHTFRKICHRHVFDAFTGVDVQNVLSVVRKINEQAPSEVQVE